jgi:DNA-directed RNA polymerase specialized sigma24 family protein
MTKKELGQFASLRAEIKDIRRRMDELDGRETPMVQDKVRSSGKEWPYIDGHTTIHGIDIYEARRMGAKRAELLSALKARLAKAEELEAGIEEYINTIEDSRVRRMIEYRYVRGYTSENVGRLMHCDRTTVEKTIKRYLESHP